MSSWVTCKLIGENMLKPSHSALIEWVPWLWLTMGCTLQWKKKKGPEEPQNSTEKKKTKCKSNKLTGLWTPLRNFQQENRPCIYMHICFHNFTIRCQSDILIDIGQPDFLAIVLGSRTWRTFLGNTESAKSLWWN